MAFNFEEISDVIDWIAGMLENEVRMLGLWGNNFSLTLKSYKFHVKQREHQLNKVI